MGDETNLKIIREAATAIRERNLPLTPGERNDLGALAALVERLATSPTPALHDFAAIVRIDARVRAIEMLPKLTIQCEYGCGSWGLWYAIQARRSWACDDHKADLVKAMRDGQIEGEPVAQEPQETIRFLSRVARGIE